MKLRLAIELLAIIVDSERQHYSNEWHLTISNDLMYAFDKGCKVLGIRKKVGPAITKKTSREEKLRRRLEKKQKVYGT